MNLKRVHLLSGLATVLFFLGTGVYLRENFPELYAGNEAIRYLFRANHVYILFSGLLNVLLGLYCSLSDRAWQRTIQRVGSVLVLLAVPFFIAAFIVEPPTASPARPLTLIGAVLAIAGVMLHLIGGVRFIHTMN